MVVVATSLDLPVKLVAPTFSKFEACSLLGLGDMVIPGFHIMFSTWFGKDVRDKGYFLTNMIAYASSLLICCLVLISTGTG